MCTMIFFYYNNERTDKKKGDREKKMNACLVCHVFQLEQRMCL